MGVVLAEGEVTVTADGTSAGRQIVRDIERQGDEGGKRAGEGMGRSVFGGIVGAWAAIGGTQLVGSLFKGAIGNASDLNETISKSNAIFGENMGAMDSWANTAKTSVGLSKAAALDAAAGFGDMFTQIGFTGDAAASMSRDVVQAAADLGSFSNLETADVADRISAAFRGEYDSLQAVIPNISAARVEMEAMAATGKTNASELTAQEKATAVLAIVQKDGSRAMGDFARTADGAANSQKIVTAQLEEQSAAFGARLLPAWTGFLGFVSTTALPGLSNLTTGLWGVFDIMTKGDFTGAKNTFGWTEDSAAVDMLFDIREGFIAMGEVAAPVFKGVLDALAPLWPALGDLIGLLAKASAETGVSTWGIFLNVVTALTPVLEVLANVVSGVVSWLGENQWVVNALVIGITAWTVAQWALNVAMAANPFGLIGIAIAALVAGIIWVATQTTFFQDTWANVTSFIGTVVTWLWESVISPVFNAIGAVFTWIFDTIIMPVVTGIMIYIGLWAALITWLYETVVSPVFAAIGAVFTWIYESIIAPVFGAIGAIFTWVYESIILPVVGYITNGIKAWGAIITWLHASVISPVFSAVGASFNWVWNNVVNPVIGWISGAITNVGNTVRSVFGGIGDFIGSAFNAALNVVKGPINGIISLVNSAISGLNKLSVTIPAWVPIVGGQTWGLNLPSIPMLARGTKNAPDMFIAGESGPELIVGAGGSKVYPADQTRRKMDGDADAKHYHLEQKIYATDPILGSRQAAREFTKTLGL